MMRIKSKNIDLTTGAVWKSLLIYFWPILLGSLFQQMYTTVDAIIVGQFAGKAGLAAVDSVYSLTKLPVKFFVGLSTGATIIVSQYVGAKKGRETGTIIHTAIAFALLGGALLSIAGVVLAPQLLLLMEIPADLYETTLGYTRVYFGGFMVSMLYNIGAGILRAMGNSKTPFHALVAAGICNILLDLLFVGAFHLSAAGAAMATVISQAVSAIYVLRALSRQDDNARLVPSKIRIDVAALCSILALGLPIALQSSLYPIANMLIQSTINATGTDNIAAWALCGKLDFMVWLIADSLASSLSTFVAQNYGAGQFGRARRGVNIGIGLALGFIAILSLGLYLWCEPLGRLFISSADAGIIGLAATFMHLLAPMYVLYAIGETYACAIRGTGESFRPMVLTLLGTCLIRVLWVLFVVPIQPGILSILMCYPVSWAATAIVFTVYYHYFKHKRLPI